MAKQSQFQSVPKKLLLRILVELDMQGEFNFDDPYEDFHLNEEILTKINKKYGYYNIDNLDVEFFCQLKNLNGDILKIYYQDKDKSISESLVTPECYKWSVDYSVSGRQWYTEDYYDLFDSYRKDWVLQMVEIMHQDGSWNWSDGRLVDKNIDDSEMDDFELGAVTLFDEKPKNLSENLKRKNIIEANNAIKKLDRKTLLQLKEMIDRRLGVI